MQRHVCVLILLLPIGLASCAKWSASLSSKNVADARLEINRCPVHGNSLIESVQTINWERGQYDPLYYRIRESLFPCAYSPLPNGDLALVTYCPKCRAAKAKCENSDQYQRLFPSLLNENVDVEAFIEQQRRELDQEYAKSTE